VWAGAIACTKSELRPRAGAPSASHSSPTYYLLYYTILTTYYTIYYLLTDLLTVRLAQLAQGDVVARDHRLEDLGGGALAARDGLEAVAAARAWSVVGDGSTVDGRGSRVEGAG
jgi:hypothetical protein